MGRIKEFLINEQMRITGNWREKDHYEYLAWRKHIEAQPHQKNETRRKQKRGKSNQLD